jgi:hypothetical protein
MKAILTMKSRVLNILEVKKLNELKKSIEVVLNARLDIEENIKMPVPCIDLMQLEKIVNDEVNKIRELCQYIDASFCLVVE